MINILSIGELLWDIFPDKKILGGAPANFVFHARQFGSDATLFTALGNDKQGLDLEKTAAKAGIIMQSSRVSHPTGTAEIILNNEQVPTYKLNDNCAWDHIPLTNNLKIFAAKADLIVFGTIAQRNFESRNTIKKALKLSKPSSKILFDINLRLNFYTKEIIEESLSAANYLKLNDEEESVLQNLFNKNIEQIISDFNLELAILTLGPKGSKIITSNSMSECPAAKCKIVDTVGAGDSFTAFFIINYLKGMSISESQKKASKVAAYVCAHNGATVQIPKDLKS
jgi:fructokinase|tara:strand:+ start:941 stop:1789 length:849 start_codon:yes stop_codon:yes gene_type:complete